MGKRQEEKKKKQRKVIGGILWAFKGVKKQIKKKE